MFSFFSSQNSASINEFADFGIFAEIHRYFRDKYTADRFRVYGHYDFYVRTKYFFELLVWIIEGRKNDHPRFQYNSKIFIDHCVNLYNQSCTSEHVTNYFIAAARKAQCAQGHERLFYQRFLAREALPVLFSCGLNEVQFARIVKEIPVEMLSQEQGNMKSDLIYMLVVGTSLQTIDRFKKIVKRIPILKKQDMKVIIFQNLLLSTRPADQERACNELREKFNDPRFISQVLCSRSFLKSLVELSFCDQMLNLLKEAVQAELNLTGESSTIRNSFRNALNRGSDDIQVYAGSDWCDDSHLTSCLTELKKMRPSSSIRLHSIHTRRSVDNSGIRTVELLPFKTNGK